MPLPSGQISLSEVNTELGISPASTLITMNDAAVRTLAGVGGSGTVISMSDLQGKGAAFLLTISGNTNNYDLYNAAVGAGWPGSSAVQLTINPGVVVGSASTGNYSFLVPSALNPAPAVTVINNGTIIGAGGPGGRGAFGGTPQAPTIPSDPGVGGGNAMYINRPTVITNNGTVAGGGGGGGGGGGNPSPTLAQSGRRFGGGGGGGAGSIVGNGAAGGTTPTPRPGSPGTLTTGGAGGIGLGPGLSAAPAYNGGAGGGQGSAGVAGSTAGANPAGSGGASGAYVVGAPLVTWPVTGTRLGPSS